MYATSYFEQIFEAAPYETAGIQPFDSYHKKNKHSDMTNKTCWRIKDELIRNVLVWGKLYIKQFSADTVCRLEDLIFWMVGKK